PRSSRAPQQRESGFDLRRDRWKRLLSRARAGGLPFADERDVPSSERGSGKAIRQRSDKSWFGWIEGPSFSGRHSSLDLQRVPEGGSRIAGRVHERVRENTWLVERLKREGS